MIVSDLTRIADKFRLGDCIMTSHELLYISSHMSSMVYGMIHDNNMVFEIYQWSQYRWLCTYYIDTGNSITYCDQKPTVILTDGSNPTMDEVRYATLWCLSNVPVEVNA